MKKKIFGISLAIMAVVLLLYAILSTQLFYNSSIEQTQTYLKVYASFYEADKYTFDNAGACAYSADLGGARVTFMAENGVVTGDSDDNDLVGIDHSSRSEVVEAGESGSGFATRSSDTLGKDMIYYCVKTENGFVRVALYTSSALTVLSDSIPTIIWFLLVDILICVIFTYFATEYIISPVRQIAKDAALNRKLKTNYKELEPIVDILNKRNVEISAQLKEISEERDLVEKAQKSKNEFIANITHEMNTPLTSIKGYVDLLAGGLLNEEQSKAAYETIRKQSDRLTNLVACVINYNEIDNDELPPYEVNASKLLDEILLTMKPVVEEKGITLTSDIEENLLLQSRYERLNQVFGNIIRNAIRYNKENGSIAVTLKREGDKAFFAVADTGIGIDESHLERIFDRFYTVDKSHNGKNGGFGLGLAVVKKICKRSGWTIKVKSEVGVGTTFTVTF